VANENKPTTRMVLSDVMKPLADALEAYATARQGPPGKIDPQGARDATALALDIRSELDHYERTDSIQEGEESTKRLQRFRSSALEILARK